MSVVSFDAYKDRKCFLIPELLSQKNNRPNPSTQNLYNPKIVFTFVATKDMKMKFEDVLGNERAHTLQELVKLETVRNYLIERGVCDLDGLKDLQS